MELAEPEESLVRCKCGFFSECSRLDVCGYPSRSIAHGAEEHQQACHVAPPDVSALSSWARSVSHGAHHIESRVRHVINAFSRRARLPEVRRFKYSPLCAVCPVVLQLQTSLRDMNPANLCCVATYGSIRMLPTPGSARRRVRLTSPAPLGRV